ncbi:alpha/beta hydrolase [Candidatus Clostridium stratigraminis]|uniref:Alpha/beta hydrolase n=1 Tax=Candidatus Clostridium stratigraminis TaxID=3381661 RepID=A0ABW8T2M0_9CLOT
MAFITCNFSSEVLGMNTSIYVILPQNKTSQIGKEGSFASNKYKALYLLHGLSGDHTDWQRKTSIERYVDSMGLAVVMPDAGKSFYTDMKNGERYFTYIAEELPKIARQFFPLSEKREDNFIAGLSMGGYGAFKIALSCPEKYAAAASLSGALDMTEIVSTVDDTDNAGLYNIFGDLSMLAGSENDLYFLAKKLLISKEPKPKLYQCCGTEDFLYGINQNFKKFIETTNIDFTYNEGSGEHTWDYWDAEIQKVLKWLPL